MRENASRLILVLCDIAIVYISIIAAYALIEWSGIRAVSGNVEKYTETIIIYVLVLLTFIALKIYRYRHDFWEETRLIIKGLIFAMLMVVSVLSLNKTASDYSNTVIVLSFMLMGILMPVCKLFLKRQIGVFGLWPKKASVRCHFRKSLFGLC